MLSVVVVPTNSLTLLRANAIALRVTLEDIAALDHPVHVEIDWRGRRTMRRLDGASDVAPELPQAPPFGVG